MVVKWYSTVIDIIFNVYSFSWSETIVVKMVAPTDGSVIWTHTVAHRWGCLVSSLISSVVVRWLHWTWLWPGDYIGHGPTDVSHGRWGCLSSWLFTSRSWPGDYIGHGLIDVCHGKGKSRLWLLSFKNVNKVPFPKQKTNDSRDKTSQSKQL